MTEPRVIEAHKHSKGHRAEVLGSEQCGCFYCGAVFAPDDIVEWVHGGDRALCPKCSIDSVIGSKAGYPLTPEFLSAMGAYWFSPDEGSQRRLKVVNGGEDDAG